MPTTPRVHGVDRFMAGRVFLSPTVRISRRVLSIFFHKTKSSCWDRGFGGCEFLNRGLDLIWSVGTCLSLSPPSLQRPALFAGTFFLETQSRDNFTGSRDPRRFPLTLLKRFFEVSWWCTLLVSSLLCVLYVTTPRELSVGGSCLSTRAASIFLTQHQHLHPLAGRQNETVALFSDRSTSVTI